MFDPEITTNIQSFLMELSSLSETGSARTDQITDTVRSGLKDRMMYPLITTGAIGQRKQIVRGPWHHESGRPSTI